MQIHENNSQNIIALDLSEVKQGFYYLACLPLKITKSDGIPARAVLIKKER